MAKQSIIITIVAAFLLLFLADSSSAENQPLLPGWHSPIVTKPFTLDEAHTLLRTPNARSQQATIAETEITPEIEALARGLENDPALIFEYVHNHITYEPYFGSKKSATATLLAGRGNDVDQTSLLIALLREAGFTANYRTADVSYEAVDLADWLAVDPSNINNPINTLLNAGIPFSQVGATTVFQVQRTYAEAVINAQTVRLDPAYKSHIVTSGIDLDSVFSYERNAFLTRALQGATNSAESLINLNSANITADATTHAMELVNHILNNAPDASVADIIGGQQIVPIEVTAFSADLPDATAIANEQTFNTLPNSVRHSVRIDYEGIDQTLFFHEIVGKRLTLSFNGSNQPELMLDDTVLATGNVITPSTIGTANATITHPSGIGNQSGGIVIQNGLQSYAFLYDFNGSSADMLQHHLRRLQHLSGEAATLEAIHLTSLLYVYQQGLIERLIGQLANEVVINYHTFGVVGSGTGRSVDIPLGVTVRFGRDGNPSKFDSFLTSGLTSSMLEHGILQQLPPGGDAVSTIRMLQNANDTGETVFFATAANWQAGSNIRSQLTGYNASTLALMDSLINNNQELVVPKVGDMTIDDFVGSGFIGVPDNNSEGMPMIISGGLNGGNGTNDQGIVGDKTFAEKFNLVFHSSTNQNLSYAEKVQALEPIEMRTGFEEIALTDLRLGPPEPMGLTFSRSYNSGIGGTDELGNGWTHNHAVQLTQHSFADGALGDRQAAEMAAAITYAYLTTDLLGNATPDLADWMSTTILTKWLMDQLVDHAVTVETNQTLLRFVQLPDGSFLPPPRSVAMLQQITRTPNTTHQLVLDDGTTIAFDTDGRITQQTDVNGNTLIYTYSSDKLTQVATSHGYTLTLNYTGDKLTMVSDSSGRSVTFAYTGDNLTSFTDAEGNSWPYSYDGDDRLVSWFFPTDLVTPAITNVYDSFDRVIQQTDGEGQTSNLFYARFRNTEVSADGRKLSHHFDKNGLYVALEDADGNQTTRRYDGNFRVVQTNHRDGAQETVTYHAPSGRVATFTDAAGNTHTNSYTVRSRQVTNFFGLFNLTQETFADDTTRQMQHNAAGLITQITDQAGKVYSFTYNANGTLAQSVNPEGGTVDHSYHANGSLHTITDSDVGVTTITYDTAGRPTRVLLPDGNDITLTYDGLNNIKSVTDENNRTTTFAYDAAGLLASITDAAGEVIVFAVDGLGRRVSVTDRELQTSTRVFDALGHVTRIVDASNVSADFTYDANGSLASVTVGGQTLTFDYSNGQQLASVTTPLGSTVTFGRNQHGDITTQTDPLNRSSTTTYDAMRRRTAFTDAAGQTTNYAYDSRGLLTSVTDPVVGSATYTRSDNGYLTGITDLNGQQWVQAFTTMGRLSSLTDPLGRQTTLARDTRGRVETVTYPDATTQTLTYDGAGNLTRRQYTDGVDLTYTYDELNRLTNSNGLAFGYDKEGRVTRTTNETARRGVQSDIPNTVFYDATYDAAGRLKTASYNGGATVVTYTYDANSGLLTNVTDSLSSASVSFIYDNDFRLTGITRSNGINMNWTLDNAGQPTRIQDGTVLDLQYTFDAAGRIASANISAPLTPEVGLTAGSVANTYDAASQSAESTYDARGRRTVDGNRSYSWDDADRLTALSGGTTLTYSGLGDVIERTANAQTSSFHYHYAVDGKPLVAEEQNSTIDKFYVYTPGGRLLYLIDVANGNQARFYHFDYAGNTLALSDSGGVVTDAYAYTPFGREVGRSGSTEQPFTFGGAFGVRREAQNLYQMRVRYYDAESGQFISREPI